MSEFCFEIDHFNSDFSNPVNPTCFISAEIDENPVLNRLLSNMDNNCHRISIAGSNFELQKVLAESVKDPSRFFRQTGGIHDDK